MLKSINQPAQTMGNIEHVYHHQLVINHCLDLLGGLETPEDLEPKLLHHTSPCQDTDSAGVGDITQHHGATHDGGCCAVRGTHSHDWLNDGSFTRSSGSN